MTTMGAEGTLSRQARYVGFPEADLRLKERIVGNVPITYHDDAASLATGRAPPAMARAGQPPALHRSSSGTEPRWWRPETVLACTKIAVLRELGR